MEPIDYQLDIPNHPAVLGRVLYEAGFKAVKEITKIGKFRFRIELDRKQDYEQLKQVDLGKANIKLFEPSSLKETICFVPGVPLDFGEQELLNNTEAESGARVTRIERLKRMTSERKLMDTANLKIVVDGKQMPRAFKIFGAFFTPKLYIFPVKQSRKCWK